MEVLKKMDAEHVPKASLAKVKGKENVKFVQLGIINRKIPNQNKVWSVQHVPRVGLKKTQVNRFATTPVASNLKIAATTNIGYPTNSPTKKQNPEPVATIAHRVGRAQVPLAKRAFVPCSGGQNAQCQTPRFHGVSLVLRATVRPTKS